MLNLELYPKRRLATRRVRLDSADLYTFLPSELTAAASQEDRFDVM